MSDKNKTAVITGASSGLGEVYAKRFASEGYDLLLTARREEKLQAIAEQLKNEHGVQVEIYKADLADDEQVKTLADHLEARDDIHMLVNNAGFGTAGLFADVDVQPQIDMIQVHVIAAMRLARAVLPQMCERKQGDIINVASVAGFLTGAGSVSYCATKGYLISASKSLAAEVKRRGVRVQALCPGFFYSGFHDTDQMEHFERTQIPKYLWLAADYVVDCSLKSLRKGRVICIPALRYRLIVAALTTPIISTLLQSVFESRVDRLEK